MKHPAKFGCVVVLHAFLVGLALQSPASARNAATLTLKPVVQVAADEVTLQDFVGNGDSVRYGDIVICHAPAMGTVRTVTRADVMAVLKKHQVTYLLRGAEQISVMRLGRKVSAADLQPLIEAALSKNGGVTISAVELQAAIFVNDMAAIRLRKLRFDPAINKYRAWFTVSDSPHGVSFEAMATPEHGVTPQEIKTASSGPGSSGPGLAVRRGEKAAMQLTGEGFSATLAVVCLEDGVEEKIVRVREPATKRIYRAQIIGQGLLRAVGREN